MALLTRGYTMPEPLPDLMHDPQQLFAMALHDEIKIRECTYHGSITVYRVPGGWIYTHTHYDDIEQSIATTFVPWNEYDRDRPCFNAGTFDPMERLEQHRKELEGNNKQ